jgi:hypothetical protein
MRRLAPLACSLFLALAVAPAADARWFAAEAVDGPGAIERPVVDLAREQGGGLVYVKNGQAWLSRLQRGSWTAPAALSGAGATEAVVAAGEKGRLVAAWVQAGVVYGAQVGSPPVALSTGAGASDLAIDLGVNGVAYVVWTQNGDVRAARLGTTWSAVPLPLDIDPAHSAGTGASRPRVAVAADGSAVVVWGEALPDGLTHVFARRIYDTTLSALPQDATLPVFEGGAGGAADSPEVDVEFDRSYAWVAFRQTVGGQSRSIARRLRASSFQEPYALDRGLASTQPHLAMSSGGIGQAVSVTTGGLLYGAKLRDDVFGAAARSDSAGAVSGAAVVTSERNDSALLWRSGALVRGRLAPERGALGGEAVLSRGALGAAAPGELSASSNRVGDVAVAVLQGAPGGLSLGVAMYDHPPSRPRLRSVRSAVGPRPLIRWTPGQEFVGPQRFRVLVDGRVVKTTPRTSLRLKRLRAGTHRVQVVAVDRRGQRSPVSRSDTFHVRG